MRRNPSQGSWALLLAALAGGVAVAAQLWGAWTVYATFAALGIAIVLLRSYALSRRRLGRRASASLGAAAEMPNASPKAAPATFADPRSAAAEAFGAESGGSRLRRRAGARR